MYYYRIFPVVSRPSTTKNRRRKGGGRLTTGIRLITGNYQNLTKNDLPCMHECTMCTHVCQFIGLFQGLGLYTLQQGMFT